MVWFQCEDCGDNLKKPKLPTHFRQCSAFKVSRNLLFTRISTFSMNFTRLLDYADDCSADFALYQLSCIDCGQVFGQHDVESHTQCITEAVFHIPFLNY